MKLFWGLIETDTPHSHTYNPNKWKLVATAECSTVHMSYGRTFDQGSRAYYQNTCLTCGELVEKTMSRTIQD